MISILIADDHKLIRETWTYILNRDARFKVIGILFQFRRSCTEMTAEIHPDIVLMDINMVPFFGIEATRQIREVSPETPHYRCYHAFPARICQKNAAAGCQWLCY